MGRYAGSRSALKKQRQKIARRLGVPMRKVSMKNAAIATGMRIEGYGNARPGAVIPIARPKVRYYDRAGNPVYEWTPKGSAPTVDKALSRMKKLDPMYLNLTKKKNFKN